MLKEVGSIMTNNEFELAEKRPEIKVLPLMWTYRIKTQSDNTILGLVAKAVLNDLESYSIFRSIKDV